MAGNYDERVHDLKERLAALHERVRGGPDTSELPTSHAWEEEEIGTLPFPFYVTERPYADVRNGAHRNGKMGNAGAAGASPTPPRPSASRALCIEPLSVERCEAAKAAFTTRNIDGSRMRTLVRGPVRPRSGDIVLARVERIGQHPRLELVTGRRANLHIGDEIIVAYADRYAPDQFEAHVPMDLGATQLVAGGGVAGRVLSRSRDVARATAITPVGLVGDERGIPLNVADGALPPVNPTTPRPPTIAVVGTSMNSGKTTTIRFLVNALHRAGHEPGAAKVTGTGSGGDYWVMRDAGARRMLDFTDVGLASTYRVPINVIEQKLLQLVDHLTDSGCGAILIEVADGLYQRETANIVRSDAFRSCVDGVIFAASDALGAAGGVSHLRRIGVPVIAVSGRLTRSPLAVREARQACALPVVSPFDLRNHPVAEALMGLAPVISLGDADANGAAVSNPEGARVQMLRSAER